MDYQEILKKVDGYYDVAITITEIMVCLKEATEFYKVLPTCLYFQLNASSVRLAIDVQDKGDIVDVKVVSTFAIKQDRISSIGDLLKIPG